MAKMATPKAIPTLYKGIQFKSRFEADVAMLLDKLGWKYEYEPLSFLLDNGQHYQPDFWLPKLRLWLECRGYDSEKGEMQLDGFAKWIQEGRVGREMTLVGPASDLTSSYLIIRGDAGPEFYAMHFATEGIWAEEVFLAYCERCHQWYIGTDIADWCWWCREKRIVSHCFTFEGQQGRLVLTEGEDSWLLRDWLAIWPQKVEKGFIQCGNWACRRSSGVATSEELTSEWIVQKHRNQETYFCCQLCLGHHFLTEWAALESSLGDPSQTEILRQAAKIIAGSLAEMNAGGV